MPKYKIKILGDPAAPAAQVEYQRRDEADLCITENLILPAVNNSTLQDSRSIAVLWGVPSGDPKRGNLLALRSVRCVLENAGPFTVNARVERPYGFESDPTGCAFWEPLVRGAELKLEPDAKRVITFGFVNNNFIVPKREYVGAKDCVHLLSMALTRSQLTHAGNDLDRTLGGSTIALKATYSVIYESDGQQVGNADAFVVRYYTTDTHMRYTNYPPSPPVSIGQLRCPGGQVQWCRFTNASPALVGKGGDVAPVALLVKSKSDGSGYRELEGLDKLTIYDLDAPIPCYKNQTGGFPQSISGACTVAARKLRWFNASRQVTQGRTYNFDAGWYLCMTGSENDAAKIPVDWAYMLEYTAGPQVAVGINMLVMPEPTPTTKLTPANRFAPKLIVKGKHQVRGPLRQCRTRDFRLTHPTELGTVPWYDTVIEAATVVV